jgi:hypothetical protein
LYSGQLGHTYAFYSLATDVAGNRQPPPSQPDAQTSVNLTNSPPVVLGSTNVSINEGQTLSLTLPASDPDPGQVLVFSLGPGAPSGLTLNPVSGLLVWPTSEANGPSTNAFQVYVTDNGQPSLSATSVVTIIVHAVNHAPTLSPIADRIINEGSLLSITNMASDPDVPAQTLTFSLGAGTPAGCVINPTNGIISWTPAFGQGPSTNLITVVVTDNGNPPLSATQQFNIVVRHLLGDFAISFGWTNVLAGESNTLPLVLRASQPITNITLQFTAPLSQLTNFGIRPLGTEVTAASLVPVGTNAFAMTLLLDPSQRTSSVRPIATLDFLSVSNGHSAVAFVTPTQPLSGEQGGPALTNGTALAGRVIVIALEPVMDVASGLPLQITLYGVPGTGYSILSSSNLFQNMWAGQTNVVVTNRAVVLPISTTGGSAIYYRAQKQ